VSRSTIHMLNDFAYMQVSGRLDRSDAGLASAQRGDAAQSTNMPRLPVCVFVAVVL